LDDSRNLIMRQHIIDPLGGHAKRKCSRSNGIGSSQLIILRTKDN
jgi:hypothetical protein